MAVPQPLVPSSSRGRGRQNLTPLCCALRSPAAAPFDGRRAIQGEGADAAAPRGGGIFIAAASSGDSVLDSAAGRRGRGRGAAARKRRRLQQPLFVVVVCSRLHCCLPLPRPLGAVQVCQQPRGLRLARALGGVEGTGRRREGRSEGSE